MCGLKQSVSVMSVSVGKVSSINPCKKDLEELVEEVNSSFTRIVMKYAAANNRMRTASV